MNRRPFATPMLCFLLLAGALVPGWPRSASAQQDEIVPGGVWLIGVSLTTDSHDSAIARTDQEAPLLDYLVPDEGTRNRLDGAVERAIERRELRVTYGLSDTWNLELHVPSVQVDQTSTVTATSANAAAQAAAARLTTESISGLGSIRLMSLHRPVFSDRHGFIWGFGLTRPGEDPKRAWAGRGTLELDSPVPSVLVVTHYTYYPFAERTRIDLRAELDLPMDETVALDGGGVGSLNTGNSFIASVGWLREFGSIATGVTFSHRIQAEARIDGGSQGDNVLDTSLRVSLGYGNLTELERGPLAFPYALELAYESTVQGYNTPLRNELRGGFKFYF